MNLLCSKYPTPVISPSKKVNSLISIQYFQKDATKATQRSQIDKHKREANWMTKVLFDPSFHSSPEALLDITARAPINESQQSSSVETSDINIALAKNSHFPENRIHICCTRKTQGCNCPWDGPVFHISVIVMDSH